MLSFENAGTDILDISVNAPQMFINHARAVLTESVHDQQTNISPQNPTNNTYTGTFTNWNSPDGRPDQNQMPDNSTSNSLNYATHLFRNPTSAGHDTQTSGGNTGLDGSPEVAGSSGQNASSRMLLLAVPAVLGAIYLFSR